LRPGTVFLVATLALSVLLALIFGYQALKRQVFDELQRDADSRLTLFSASLQGVLEKYEYLPLLISSNTQLRHALEYSDESSIKAANRYLEQVARDSAASDVYLMNIGGETIASSNYNLPHSFVGRNFSFRPYFLEAMAGQSGRYFALGTTSNQRGYYFSRPVQRGGNVIGVVVVKITLAEIESAWAGQGTQFMVTDTDGIVFLSTIPAFRYRSLEPLSNERLTEIHNSRRYGQETITALAFTRIDPGFDGVATVSVGDRSSQQQYLWLTRAAPASGWTNHILVDTHLALQDLFLRAAVAALLLLILVLMGSLYLLNRRRRVVLQDAAENLENRVRQRTEQLEIEIDERRKAEQSLRDTQSELIHAAKMAGLGEMSAGISHELNQPLTAIRTYAENARRMLERNLVHETSSNLEEIDELTERMAHIIRQLRGFSRKSSGEKTVFSVDGAVNQALALFSKQIESAGVSINLDISPELTLNTDPVLLNQVLVNLISNALYATRETDDPEIRISARTNEKGVEILVNDNGTGIDEGVIDNIFDPFFTTKQVGLGLGLGLSISYRIVSSLGGRIKACNNAQGGAVFTVSL